MELVPYKRDPIGLPRPFYCVQWEVCDPKEGSHLIVQTPCSWTFNLQDYEQSISAVHKVPSLSYFVTASRTEWEAQEDQSEVPYSVLYSWNFPYQELGIIRLEM